MLWRVLDPLPQCDEARGLEQDLQVEPQRPLLEVAAIQRHHLADRDRRGASDLPDAGHARSHREPAPMAPDDRRVLLRDEWPGADQAHPAEDHIEQLWQLVERGGPEPGPDLRDSRVAVDLEEALGGLVEVEQLRLLLVG